MRKSDFAIPTKTAKQLRLISQKRFQPEQEQAFQSLLHHIRGKRPNLPFFSVLQEAGKHLFLCVWQMKSAGTAAM